MSVGKRVMKAAIKELKRAAPAAADHITVSQLERVLVAAFEASMDTTKAMREARAAMHMVGEAMRRLREREEG